MKNQYCRYHQSIDSINPIQRHYYIARIIIHHRAHIRFRIVERVENLTFQRYERDKHGVRFTKRGTKNNSQYLSFGRLIFPRIFNYLYVLSVTYRIIRYSENNYNSINYIRIPHKVYRYPLPAPLSHPILPRTILVYDTIRTYVCSKM